MTSITINFLMLDFFKYIADDFSFLSKNIKFYLY